MFALMVSYIILGLSIAAPIGPINVEIMKRGLLFGFWPAFCVGLGGMSSDIILMALMFFGLSSILQIKFVSITLMLFGCIILIYSGWSSLLSKNTLNTSESDLRPASRLGIRSYLKGFSIAGTNPMNILFWVSIYGSVLSHALNSHTLGYAFLLSTLVFIGIGLWNLNLAFTIHFARILMSPIFMKLINVVASLILIAYGIYFGILGVTEIFL
ncbi:LysE family translocator [Pontibacillus marinus]|uniref:Amino acid transporter n=1 Tax=Pontibacillus marinus BH030004 = DSM 16465 TaxID=1385511 RepID=A0A0A5GC32_9BACI|nr:LysE family translocator [Pontibacillus marinus]KGX89559.1 amino acid transporter [Pontibacillus marinus BH030004 = DSM 16465]